MSQNTKTEMMKFKVLFLIVIVGLLSFSANAQRGVRIGYIDTEYILQNVPEYQEASTQLDKKVQDWKAEIDSKLKGIEQKKKELDNERVLLTKELYDERYEDISFEEAEILDYQQKRFGPEGDLMIQKRQLIEPIQDQIFAAVQDIAETGKYDFVFDKSADVVMLYSAERYDISERVLKTITRSSKRSQAKSKKERKELEAEEVVPEVSDGQDARQKALDDKKAKREEQLAAKRAEREKAAEDRKKAQEALRETKRLEAEARRQKATDARNNRAKSSEEAKTVEKDSTSSARPTVQTDSTKAKDVAKKDSASSAKPKTAAEIAAAERLQKAKDREARQKELEDRKKKIIEQRKKAREEREKQVKRNDSIAKAKKNE
ncbi:periplasmic chaperone for outer membrane proteins Skp [Winogradskyella eximia]|jgi:Skp family chaperone for outer membrane proteins|uniref:Periplasmic chaperone for outer membrane proteins Skp n=1 Tax=Winogradskyella eximia TaxID=262006 RepID=A0A3D9H0S3_9FLAO|nr:OmpH family outer membrane protein [Winogradskyella eximia]RED43112.1 periplasmic chaperone for outer membrane proteins Skp [Winogradskyella eximia]